MSMNPYEAPQFPNVGPSAGPGGRGVYDSAFVRRQVSGPATAMLIVASIWAVILVLGIGFDIYLLASGMVERFEDASPLGVSKRMMVSIRTSGAVLLFLLNLCTLYGSLQMKGLRSLGWARTAAILSVIPCTSTCYFLGIPFGIWSLVVLNKPEVQREFR